MLLSGHVVLIIEPYERFFGVELQKAIEREGGDSIVAYEPTAALVQCKTFEFTAALVNCEHRGIVSKLRMPATVYGPADSYHTAIDRLEELLETTRLH